MAAARIKGVLSPVVTPFKRDLSPDVGRFIAQELSGYLPASAAASSRASWKRFRLASALTTIQARSAASGLSGARLFACRASSIAR